MKRYIKSTCAPSAHTYLRLSVRQALRIGASLAIAGTHAATAEAAQPFPAVRGLSRLDGTNGFIVKGASPGDRAGDALAAAGDINGDSVADLLIGGPGTDADGKTYAGATYVLLGRHGIGG